MDKDVLSDNEVESLLGAFEFGDADNNFEKKSTDSLTPVAPASDQGRRISGKVSPYDFKRPERVGKEQMRALQSMHEGLGRNFGASLSAMLRSIVEVNLTSVDELTYSEFVFSLENPSCFNLLKATPLEGNLILDLNPTILYPIIDRLLGGGKENAVPARRPLTEIELRLVRRITDLFLRELKNAWSNVVDLSLEVDRVESNPQLVQVVPPNEVVVLISFELSLNEVRGMINLCIPFNAIERIANKLTANNWFNLGSKQPTDQTQRQMGQQLGASIVEVIVELAEAKVTTEDLLGLCVGDIITTDQDCHALLPVTVEGIRKFYALPGAAKGHKAFQVESTIESRPAARDEGPTADLEEETELSTAGQ